MTDIRTQIAKEMRWRPPYLMHANWAEDLADVILSMPGIAHVVLPERLPGYVDGELLRWEVGPTVVQVDHFGHVLLDGAVYEADEARALAARLLAAADAAEQS